VFVAAAVPAADAVVYADWMSIRRTVFRAVHGEWIVQGVETAPIKGISVASLFDAIRVVVYT
jgi:hypothetical protein